MGKFVKSIEIKREFEGDSAVFAVRPMDKATALKLQSFKNNRVPVPGKDGKFELEASEETVQFLNEAFEKHIESIVGIKDSDGNALDKEVIIKSAYFSSLLISVASEWTSKSLPGN